MTDRNNFRLSRRQALTALGTIGVASAGAGLGTTAYFSDTESFDGNTMTAGKLDLAVDYYSYVDQGDHGMLMRSGSIDGEPAVSGTLDDVKPGDNGKLGFCFHIDDNPAYMWLCGDLTANSDNGGTEPEKLVDGSTGEPGAWEGELAQSIQVTASYCETAATVDGAEDFTTLDEIWSGSLSDFLAWIDGGVPLDGDADGSVRAPGSQACFDGTGADTVDNPCLCLDWEVPTTVGNEIQTDSLSFDLQFYAEQCRHNDGTRNPCIYSYTGGGWPFTEGKWSPQVVAGQSGNVELRMESPGETTQGNVSEQWRFNTEYDFEVTYDGGSNATLTVEDPGGGSAAISNAAIPGANGLLALVAKGYNGSKGGSSFEARIGNVAVDDGAIDGPTSVADDGDSGYEHLVVDGSYLPDGFTLTGTLEFHNDAQTQSDAVPEVGNYGMNVLVQY